jgi:hypothetical protein
MARQKSANRREYSLEIPDDVLAELNPRLAAALNHRMKVMEEALAATAGLRGPVNVAKQKKRDRRGIDLPGMRLESNRAADAADAIDDQDLVTLAQLKRMLKEKEDPEDVINEYQTATGGSGSGGTIEFFWAVFVDKPPASDFVGNTLVSPVPDAIVYEFAMPFDFTVSKVSLETQNLRPGGHGGVGLYDTSGNLLFEAVVDGSVVGVRQVTLASPVSLTSGTYYFAQTTDDINLSFKVVNYGAMTALINKSRIRWGRINTTVPGGGHLPSSFDPTNILDFWNDRPIAACLFE